MPSDNLMKSVALVCSSSFWHLGRKSLCVVSGTNELHLRCSMFKRVPGLLNFQVYCSGQSHTVVLHRNKR